MHIDGARALGSNEEEIQAMKERMKYDKCTTPSEQVTWFSPRRRLRILCVAPMFHVGAKGANNKIDYRRFFITSSTMICLNKPITSPFLSKK